MRIGAHLTITKGLPAAARFAAELGASTFAYFPRNPRGGAFRTISAEESAAYREVAAELGIGPLVGHVPYTVNPAGREERVRSFAREALAQDLERVAEFDHGYLVVHPGSHQGDGEASGIARVVETLTAVRGEVSGRCGLLLESMSGQGSEVGATFEQLQAIIEGSGSPDWLGVCIDSCHLFSAGWDLRTPSGVEDTLAALDRTVGLGRVRALHLNDSKFPLGSHKDRHEMLGQGHLGEDGMRAILQNCFVQELPIIIETPVGELTEYAQEIRKAREWAS